MPLRIVSRAAPVHSANIARKNQRPLQTWWRENISGARRFNLLRAPLFLFIILAPRIFHRQLLRHQRNSRRRLCRPRLFTENVALENRPFFDGQQRHARQPVQHKNAPHLGSNRDGRRSILPCKKCRLRRHVIVPKIVVHHLKSPNKLARRSPQRHHRVRPLVVALAISAEVIRARAPSRNKRKISLCIDRNRRPRITSSRARQSLISPRSNGIPSPAKLPRSNIKRSYDPALQSHCAIIPLRRTRND